MERPCGSKSRAKNRFTRAELLVIAKELGITQPSKKTMDILCQEIAAASKTDKKVKTEEMKSPAPAQAKTCVIDIERPCPIDGKRKRSGAALKPYTLSQLRLLWKNECKQLPEFRDEKPKTTGQFCALLRRRYGNLMFFPVKDVPTALTKRLVSLARRLGRFRKITARRRRIKVPSFGVGPAVGNMVVLQRLSTERIASTEHTFTWELTCMSTLRFEGFVPFDWSAALRTPFYLFNQNVPSFPIEWLETQEAYIQSLDFSDRCRVLTYTFGGDRILNAFLRGEVIVENIVNAKFKDHFEKRHLFPLAMEMYLDARQNHDREAYMRETFTLRTTPFVLYEKMRTLTFSDVYSSLIDYLSLFSKLFRLEAWERWIRSYHKNLERILQNAPPAPKQGFFTHRGVARSDFIITDPRRNVFTNALYFSTSLDMCAALDFKNKDKKDPCCLFVVQVLPGARCLFVAPLSYFRKECEVLFAPGRELFTITSMHTAPNAAGLSVSRFAVVN